MSYKAKREVTNTKDEIKTILRDQIALESQMEKKLARMNSMN